MELIIGIITLLVGISLLATLKCSRLGQLFLFSIFIIIVCSTFGAFIPFAQSIIKIAGFAIVAIIVWFGAIMIFS